MKENEIKTQLSECADYKKDVLSQVKNILDRNKVKYTENKSGSEIRIEKADRFDIASMIENDGEIPKPLFQLLIYMTGVGGYVFIRQKYN